MKNYKAIAGVILVFALGAVCGAVVTHMVQRSRMDAFMAGGPMGREEFLITRLTQRLELDGSQLERIRPIIHGTHSSIRQLHLQCRPQAELFLDDSQRRIAALLRPEQQEKFRQLIEERRRDGRRHGPGWGGPH